MIALGDKPRHQVVLDGEFASTVVEIFVGFRGFEPLACGANYGPVSRHLSDPAPACDAGQPLEIECDPLPVFLDPAGPLERL